MKRPFAAIGFSMLLSSLFATNLTIKSTIIVLTTIMVIFCAFLIFKSLRKYKIIIFSCVAVALYIVSFSFAQIGYYNAIENFSKPVEVKGVVCQTPTETDYTYNYVIKLENENYKVRYSSKNDKNFQQGDIVSGVLLNEGDVFEDDFFENSLSSKIYFTFFEGKESNLEKTGEINSLYLALGKIKTTFSKIIDLYIPSENGAIAKAMTIGEKSDISDKTINHFNYSGTSHLLVISGLHLSLWSIGIMRFAEKFSKLRKYTTIIGLVCLLGYSLLTGFSVSVIRAGVMVGGALLGKAFHRDADSINSIGIALFLILLENPFAPFSASLWFTVGSTMGILIIAQNLLYKIKEKSNKYPFINNWLFSFIITSVLISVATSIFTLPIFIVKIKMLPIASIISNILMVDLALLLMILTVLGVAMHIFGISFLANGVFTAVGAIGSILRFLAEKIGMSEWSTISVSHKYFEYFLWIGIICILLIFILKKYRKTALKTVSVILSVVFVLLVTYCSTYEYKTLIVDVINTKEKPLVLVNYKNESILVGAPTPKYNAHVLKMMQKHNSKLLNGAVLTETDTTSSIINLYNYFDVENLYFCNTPHNLFKDLSESNVSEIKIDENTKINTKNYKDYIEIFCENQKTIFFNSEKIENLFEKVKEYDIIIVCGKNAIEIKEKLLKENPKIRVFVAEEHSNISISIK
ncbi:MAG: ComEC/Rec2 family competence protein [Clostridia bacterium]|nr:ComEC/Rec2 family competence protein [Clostridia bacterium]